MNIDSEDIVVSGFEIIENQCRGKISNDYNEGKALNSHDILAKTFIYKKLEASIIFGPPVDENHQSGDAANFKYFPNKPDNFLEICRAVMANPIIAPSTEDNTEIIGIVDTRDTGESSATAPFTNEEKQFAQSVINNLSKVENIVNFDNALSSVVLSLNNIIFSDATGETIGTFIEYWNNRPLTDLFLYIIGSSGIQLNDSKLRMHLEKLWYKYLSNELLTTFKFLMEN